VAEQARVIGYAELDPAALARAASSRKHVPVCVENLDPEAEVACNLGRKLASGRGPIPQAGELMCKQAARALEFGAPTAPVPDVEEQPEHDRRDRDGSGEPSEDPTLEPVASNVGVHFTMP
jgi:hypothetical protein